MIRWVFRPYTQFRRTICTSVSRWASIRVSSDFTLNRYSSPSFGSLRNHSATAFSLGPLRNLVAFTMQISSFVGSSACDYVRLLGPCFKTGRSKLTTWWPLCDICTEAFTKYYSRMKRNASRPMISRLLNLPSKYFSTFAHATCLLSISCW